MNTTFGDGAATQLQYELNLDATPDDKLPKQNKIVLSLIWFMGLGFIGVDRCYMGQTILGIIKGITGGGFVIWGLVDYVNIFFNCLLEKPTIQSMGFNAQFAQSQLFVAMLIVVFSCVC